MLVCFHCFIFSSDTSPQGTCHIIGCPQVRRVSMLPGSWFESLQKCIFLLRIIPSKVYIIPKWSICSIPIPKQHLSWKTTRSKIQNITPPPTRDRTFPHISHKKCHVAGYASCQARSLAPKLRSRGWWTMGSLVSDKLEKNNIHGISLELGLYSAICTETILILCSLPSCWYCLRAWRRSKRRPWVKVGWSNLESPTNKWFGQQKKNVDVYECCVVL